MDIVKRALSVGIANLVINTSQYSFRYNASQPGVKEKITEMTLNNNDVRDINRALQISKNTVISVLKKTTKVNPYWSKQAQAIAPQPCEVYIGCRAKAHEFWRLCTAQRKPAMDLVCNGKRDKSYFIMA